MERFWIKNCRIYFNSNAVSLGLFQNNGSTDVAAGLEISVFKNTFVLAQLCYEKDIV
jgi:hypothetical protein